MDDLQEYISQKDKFINSYLQKTGQAIYRVNELKDYLNKYIESLSSDAVPSPDFIRDFSAKITMICKLLEV